MKRNLQLFLVSLGLVAIASDAYGRGGFGGGGFRGGGGFGGGSFGGSRGSFGGGGYGGGSFGGSRSYGAGGGEFGHGYSSYSGGNRFGGSYSGSRSAESYSGWGGRGAEGSYSHTYDTQRGGSISTSGTRGAGEGAFGGFAAGGSRDTSIETAGGKSYSGSRDWGVAGGPGGRTIGGASGSLSGPRGTNSWESAFGGNRYTGNMRGYSSVYGANGLHSTAYWSHGSMATRAGDVRTGFGYYGAFHPAWYANHPGCWAAAGWAAGAAWATPNYAALAAYWGWPASELPPDYDYGSSVIYNDNSVYVNGQDQGTPQQFADQATAIATQGQTANPPPTEDWKALGVFALVEGKETSSNNVFQLAVNKDGIVRGNFYDGITDSNTEVFGSVDKTTQRAAWTIGKKKDRVFEAGVFNLTQQQCPCLVHIGTSQTNQMLLVRIEQPKSDAAAAPPAP